jgi:glycosyltransferase involved in cell wall biosynthesis
MKIGIDARMMGTGFGIGRYITQLVHNLEKLDRKNEYVVFLTKKNWNDYNPTRANFKKVLADLRWYTCKEQVFMPRIISKEHVDLMHFPHFNVPIFYRKPFVVTIHDLIMFHHPRPEATTHGRIVFKIKDIAHRFVVRHAVKKAKHIIVTTEFTKGDVANTLGVMQKKMSVIYQAPFVQDRWAKTDKKVLSKYGITKEYILYVGSAYPHKNLVNLLKAWKLLEPKYGDTHHLVLVGNKDYFYERLVNSEEFGACKNILHTGFVHDDELASLYSWSNLYVFPSLYEGFGLPPLEAMHFNIPVVSSSETCLPEVLGDASVYFDPYNPQHISEVISVVLEDKDVQMRLIQSGRARLKELSAQEFAKKTCEVYRNSVK